ncbi:hypothetical protein [Palleronia caenipelagi]|uniref:Uncharacterized protein n=1 Tax=Palleronia caenipelagi TaxID=2489174 RepID=A0A547Q029_9RHOB|nr:hypothetical protein [Palleronia caenipelagi]TRD19734.1 hypothetical protein FEV53_10545 [Palleronia caenipelagi]
MSEQFGELREHVTRIVSTSPIRAVRLCNRHGFDIAHVYRGHFVLSPKIEPSLLPLREVPFDMWTLYHGEGLPVATARTCFNTVRVAILGVAVDSEGIVLTNETLTSQLGHCRSVSDVIDHLIHCAGRYAFVVVGQSVARVYGDPGNTLGFVHDPESGRVGSTLDLVLNRAEEPNTSYPLSPARIGVTGAYFAFGETQDRVVRRVLANHFLDLTTGKSERFWPTGDEVFEICHTDKQAQEEVLGEIIARHQQVIATLAEQFNPTFLPLTGGRESRLLLACGLDAMPHIDMLFTHVTNFANSLDQTSATLLAALVARKLRVINGIEAVRSFESTHDVLREFTIAKLRIGARFEGGATQDMIARLAVTESIPRGGIVLRGYGTDILKASFWSARAQHCRTELPKPEHVLKMMRLAGPASTNIQSHTGRYWRNPEMQDRFAIWQSSLPENAQPRLYEFSFLEQAQTYRTGVGMYQMARNFYLSPGNDRRIIGMMAALPPDLRQSMVFHETIYRMLGREDLGRVPYVNKLKDMSPDERAALGHVPYKELKTFAPENQLA